MKLQKEKKSDHIDDLTDDGMWEYLHKKAVSPRTEPRQIRKGNPFDAISVTSDINKTSRAKGDRKNTTTVYKRKGR